ncbi:MAG: hypothetical protein ABFC62_10375 [Clostridiaceae bacterium]
MLVECIDAQRYKNIIDDSIIYQSSAFCELNKSKVDELIYLLFQKGSSPRFALCMGVQNGIAKCPFSAPFGMPLNLRKQLGIDSYDECIDSLHAYAEQEKWLGIRFTLPPLFYSSHELSAWINTLYRKGYGVEIADINYQFNLKEVWVPEYENLIAHNARKNLRIAHEARLALHQCEDEREIRIAYDIIAENRAAKGYPLRMTYEQVTDTIRFVKHDVFVVSNIEEPIAAAIVYHVMDKIVQVIYWGDRLGFHRDKPINYLAFKLIEFYGKKGFDYLDIGPSTENSQPNYGLCDFKESIGCERDIKLTFQKNFAIGG